MCISGAIYCSICVDPVQPTFFDRFFIVFWEKCSPPSLGSMIFKAACMQNFEKLTSWPSKLIEQVPLWKHLLHLKINKYAWKNEYFLFMASIGKLGFALCVTSPTFWNVFSHFRLVLSAYTTCTRLNYYVASGHRNHDFESCMYAKSLAKSSLAPQFDGRCTCWEYLWEAQRPSSMVSGRRNCRNNSLPAFLWP